MTAHDPITRIKEREREERQIKRSLERKNFYQYIYNINQLTTLQADFKSIASHLKTVPEFQKLVAELTAWHNACHAYDEATLRACATYMKALRRKLLIIMEHETNMFAPNAIHEACFAALKSMHHWPLTRSVCPNSRKYLLLPLVTASGHSYRNMRTLDDKYLINRELYEIEQDRSRFNSTILGGAIAMAIVIAIGVAIAATATTGVGLFVLALIVGPAIGYYIGDKTSVSQARKKLKSSRQHPSEEKREMDAQLFSPVGLALPSVATPALVGRDQPDPSDRRITQSQPAFFERSEVVISLSAREKDQKIRRSGVASPHA